MKSLIVADLHYNLRQFDWLLEVAPRYELVILAGDLLDLAGHADLDTQIVVVSKYLARLQELTKVVVCSGNHDADERNAADERVAAWLEEVRGPRTHADGEHLALANRLITICPWWDGPFTRQTLEDCLEAAPARAERLWIWVHHLPPNRTAVSWTGHVHDGDEFLNDLIERFRPALVVSGHVHGAPFRRGGSWLARLATTDLVNPGRQLGGLPAFIELDLAAGTLAWTSLAGEERHELPGW